MRHTDDELDEMLRAADPAPAWLRRNRDAAETTVWETVERGAKQPGSSPRRAERWRGARPWVAAAAGVAVATAGVLAWPRGDGGEAYSSWTARPVAATANEASRATEACRSAVADRVTSAVPLDIEGAALIAAERRGAYVAVLLDDTSDNRDMAAYCVVRAGAPVVDGMGWGGSLGAKATAPAARSLHEIAQSSDAGVTMVGGTVGRDVRAVDVLVGGQSVSATVHAGHYVAWWPQREGSDSLSYRLHLADGSSVTAP